MKKQTFIFLALIALGLYSFTIFEGQATTGVSKGKYQKYLSLFEKVELPYNVTLDTNIIDIDKSIGKKFTHFHPDLQRGAFSRVGPSSFFAEAILFANDKITVVLYAETGPWGQTEKSYYIQSINHKGKVINSEYLISFEFNERKENYCRINKDLSIIIYNAASKAERMIKIHLDGTLEEIENKNAMAN